MHMALLGAAGQLGQELLAALPGKVTPLTRADIDLTRVETIGPALHALGPSCVINCAAYNRVDQAETEPADAFAVNALGVRELARCCRELHCLLVHFSTDHVFGLDERRTTPYAESDGPGPVNVYGASKLAGECFVRSLCPKHLVIRTCGLYGRRGTGGKGMNFVEAILHKAAAGAPLRVVDDQHCTPTSVADLAGAVTALLQTDRYGLFHVTNAGACTWFEFAQAIVAADDSRVSVIPIASAEYHSAARRPGYSVLDCGSYDRLGLVIRRSWREALDEYLRSRPT